MTHACPHCGKEINPAQMLGRVRSPKKEAASKKNAERLRRMYANAKKLEAVEQMKWIQQKPHSEMDPEFEAALLRDNPDLAPLCPKPDTLSEKKSRALQALASIQPATSLLDTPRAPFDVNLEGEPHRVTTMGKRLGLYYIGAGEPVFSRYLQEGELEELWGKRVDRS